MNIRLDVAIRDINGKTGKAIINAYSMEKEILKN